MTFNVRIFGYSGIAQVPQIAAPNFSANGPWFLAQPYNWAQNLTTNGATAVTTVAVVADTSRSIRIEVPDGQVIRYEINPPQRAGGILSAGNNSPKLSGVDVFQWGIGWTVSIVEAASFP